MSGPDLRRLVRPCLAVVLAGTVTLAACSSDDGHAASPSGATVADASTTTEAGSGSEDATSSDLSEIRIEVGEYKFDAIVAGPEDGAPVILLHGFPQTKQSWDDVLPVLAEEGYRVVAPDLRGYSPGARPLDAAEYATPELVDDVMGMADELGFDEFHLVGHDWGAMLTWNLGIVHPERVSSIAPLSVPHPLAFSEALSQPATAVDDQSQSTRSGYFEVFAAPDAEELFLADDAEFLRSIYSGPGFIDADIQAYVDHFSADEAAMTGPLNWYRGANSGIESGPVTVPTLYVWSTDDVALGRTGAELAGDHVEGPYRFEILEGVSHWIPDEAPDELNTLLLDHLATHR